MPNSVDLSQTPLISTEVVLHELGESLAISLATVQNELARYPNELGAFILDEVEITIPSQMRVDELGQIRVHVVEDTPDNPKSGQLRWRIRPVLGSTQSIPQYADQPLSVLGDVLSTEAVKRLEEMRVYSVQDLLRISRSTAGQRAVEKLLPEVTLKPIIERATLFTLPNLSPLLASTLVQMGITSPSDLVNRDSQSLADELNKRLEGKLEKALTSDDLNNLQSSVRPLTQVRLPGSQPRLEPSDLNNHDVSC